MAAPDHKPDLLEDQEAWMREWVSVKVSALDPFGVCFCTYASLSEQSRGMRPARDGIRCRFIGYECRVCGIFEEGAQGV